MSVRCQHEAQPHAGKTEELAEGSQDHKSVASARPIGNALFGIAVGECLVDDKMPAAPAEIFGCLQQLVPRNDAPVRIVRVDGDHEAVLRPDLPERADRIDTDPRPPQDEAVFAIGRRQYRRARPAADEHGQVLDGRLHAGNRKRPDAGDAVETRRGFARRGDEIGIRQALPGGRRNVGQRRRNGIDAGRKVEPVRRCSAISPNGFADPAAMSDLGLTHCRPPGR